MFSSRCNSLLSTKLCLLDTCTNTRDNVPGSSKCSAQLGGSKCYQFLIWKDCDRECNLCACSTAKGETSQHCSGHGTCHAECSETTCSYAKCVCDEGWTGPKCEIYGKL